MVVLTNSCSKSYVVKTHNAVVKICAIFLLFLPKMLYIVVCIIMCALFFEKLMTHPSMRVLKHVHAYHNSAFELISLADILLYLFWNRVRK